MNVPRTELQYQTYIQSTNSKQNERKYQNQLWHSTPKFQILFEFKREKFSQIIKRKNTVQMTIAQIRCKNFIIALPCVLAHIRAAMRWQ